MKNIKGFTLVELLVVIALIGILTMITASTFVTAQIKGRDIKRKADLNSLSKALQMYYNDFGKFPDATPDSSPDSSKINLNIGGSLAANNYVYMVVIPTEEKLTDKPYVYEVSSKGKSYNLFADLENREDKECLKDMSDNNGKYSRSSNYYCYGIASPNTSVGTTTQDL